MLLTTFFYNVPFISSIYNCIVESHLCHSCMQMYMMFFESVSAFFFYYLGHSNVDLYPLHRDNVFPSLLWSLIFVCLVLNISTQISINFSNRFLCTFLHLNNVCGFPTYIDVPMIPSAVWTNDTNVYQNNNISMYIRGTRWQNG